MPWAMTYSLLVALAADAGCGGRADRMPGLARTIGEGLATQLGVEVARVDCPDGARASEAFRC
ncbi:MAG: hypothetical protein AAB131_13655, partial [Actinomycetota bacterium]